MATNENENDKDRRIRDLEAQVQHLSKMLIKSFNYAEEDPDTFLQNARKTTEAICRFIYTQEIGEPQKKMLLNDLAKELRTRKTVPDRILILIGTIQTYGNYGAHVQEEYQESTKEWITPCQTALANLTNWFFSEYLQGRVPMPEELEEPVKEKANSSSNAGEKRKASPLPYILAGLGATVLILIALFFYPGMGERKSGEEEGGPVAEADAGSSTPSDEQKKEKAEEATEETIDSLNAKEGSGERTRLAVLYFENGSNNAELDGLRKGLASMLISDLSELEGLQVVERDRLEEVLEEQELSNSKKFDASTAAEVGKLLGAEKILIGSYFEMMGQLRVDARTIDVETGEILHSEGLEEKKNAFFALEQKLVKRIASQLELENEKEEKTAEDGISYEAASTYSTGLELLDSGKREAARKKFQKVLELEPSFQPAKDALERSRTPS